MAGVECDLFAGPRPKIPQSFRGEEEKRERKRRRERCFQSPHSLSLGLRSRDKFHGMDDDGQSCTIGSIFVSKQS